MKLLIGITFFPFLIVLGIGLYSLIYGISNKDPLSELVGIVLIIFSLLIIAIHLVLIFKYRWYEEEKDIVLLQVI